METFDFSDFDKTQYENKNRFEENSEMQRLLVKQVLKFIPDDDPRSASIDFFFYTNASEKAEDLRKDLQKLNYHAEVTLSFHGKWLISGYTPEMKTDDLTIKNWTKEMCELGYKNDCHFDGWGMLMGL